MKIKIARGIIVFLLFSCWATPSLLALYQDITCIDNSFERTVYMLAHILQLLLIVSQISSLMILNLFSKLLIGYKISLISDFIEKDSREINISYNGIISIIIICIISFLLLQYNFIFILIIVLIEFGVGTLTQYLQQKAQSYNDNLSQSLNIFILPAVVPSVLIPLTNTSIIEYVYKILSVHNNTISLILTISGMLCFLLIVAVEAFFNFYYLIGIMFYSKSFDKTDEKILKLNDKNTKRREKMYIDIGIIDNMAEKGGFYKKIVLFFCLIDIHLTNYLEEKWYQILYLWWYFYQWLLIQLCDCLDINHIKNNAIRFCEIVAVIELLSLNMILFVYLGSDDPCSRFFELLSTVVVIPILLSSLAELKTKKFGKN